MSAETCFQHLRRRALLLILFGYFVLLFRPWNGAGHDELYYYSYLTHAVMAGDFDLSRSLHESHNGYGAMVSLTTMLSPKGIGLNMWAVGSAVLWLPFVLTVRMGALAWEAVAGQAPDWLAHPYGIASLLAVSLGSFFYGVCGVLLLARAIGLVMGRRSSQWAAAGTVLSSPVAAYIFMFGGMSHACSFFTSSLLLYVTLRCRRFQSWREFVVVGAAVGLTVLVRWQNGVLAIVPAGLWIAGLLHRRLPTRVATHVTGVAAGIVAFSALFSVQQVFWLAQYGSALTIPQGSDYMRWGAPRFDMALWSGWHGLFYHHPLMLVATAGLVAGMTRPGRRLFYFLLCVAFAGCVYVNAAALDPNAFGSYGARRFCSSVPLLAFGLAVPLGSGSRTIRVAAEALVIAGCGTTLITMELYGRGMTDAYWWHELWHGRGEVVEHGRRWLSTLGMNGVIYTGGVLLKMPLAAVAIAAAGMGLVMMASRFVRAAGVTLVNPRAVRTRVALVGAGVLLVDALVFVANPPANRLGQEFRSVVRNDGRRTRQERDAQVTDLIARGYTNPGIFMFHVSRLGRPDLTGIYLLRLKQEWPRAWATWALSTGSGEVLQEDRATATAILGRSPLTRPFGDLYHMQALDARARGDISGAMRVVRRWLRANPWQGAALLLGAEMEAERGNTRRAMEYEKQFERVAERKVQRILRDRFAALPNRTDFYKQNAAFWVEQWAELLQKRGDFEGAAWLWGIVASTGVDPRVTTSKLARVRLYQAATTTGTKELLSLLAYAGGDPDAYGRVGQLLHNAGQFEKAVAVLRDGLTKYRNNPVLIHWVNMALSAAGPGASFRELVLAEGDLGPGYWLAAGDYLARHGDLAAAEALYRRALPEVGGQPSPNFSLGWVILQQGRQGEARPYLERAVALEPANAGFIVNLARCMEADDAAAAIQLLTDAAATTSATAEIAEEIKRMRARHPEQ